LTRIERFWPLVAALALVLAALSGATGGVSTHQGLALSVVGPLAGLAFVGAGLIGWVLRPDNGTGRLLVVIGFIFLVFTTSRSSRYTSSRPLRRSCRRSSRRARTRAARTAPRTRS